MYECLSKKNDTCYKDAFSIHGNRVVDDRCVEVGCPFINSVGSPSGKGVLYLASISSMKYIPMDRIEKKLFIVRKATNSAMVAVEKYGLTLVPQLSPSAQLFSKYYGQWKKGVFTPEEIKLMGSSAPTVDNIWKLYVPEFVKEMGDRADFQKNIRRVLELLDQGTDVALICYCQEVSRCHRGIIGYFVQQKGYDVVFR